MIRALPVLALFVLSFEGAFSQNPPPPPVRPFVRASGQATVTAKPDQAQVDIGVVTQAATAQAVASANAQQLDAVLKSLRAALGPNADIKTVGYSVNPNYLYDPKERGTPTITGYTATNTVRVTTSDLAAVGRIIDVAAQSGSNSIQRLQFTLKDEQPVRSQALRDAALHARANAEAMAAGLGLKLVRVISVEQSGTVPIMPMREMAVARAMAAPAPTPVEPGMIEVQASVTVEMEVQ